MYGLFSQGVRVFFFQRIPITTHASIYMYTRNAWIEAIRSQRVFRFIHLPYRVRVAAVATTAATLAIALHYHYVHPCQTIPPPLLKLIVIHTRMHTLTQ